MARAAAKIFFGVHGVKGEPASGQAKGRDPVLGGEDFRYYVATATN